MAEYLEHQTQDRKVLGSYPDQKAVKSGNCQFPVSPRDYGKSLGVSGAEQVLISKINKLGENLIKK